MISLSIHFVQYKQNSFTADTTHLIRWCEERLLLIFYLSVSLIYCFSPFHPPLVAPPLPPAPSPPTLVVRQTKRDIFHLFSRDLRKAEQRDTKWGRERESKRMNNSTDEKRELSWKRGKLGGDYQLNFSIELEERLVRGWRSAKFLIWAGRETS